MLIAICLFILFWYPFPLIQATGIYHILMLMVLVDVIVGPVLTFIVFDKAKKNLFLDIACIVCLQLMAFAYGCWTVAEGRPIWIVFNVDRFDLVRANEVDYRRAANINKKYIEPSWIGPRWIAARLPESVDARNDLTFESIIHGIDIPQRPDLYVPLEAEQENIKSVLLPIEQLYKFNNQSDVDETLKRWINAKAYLPLRANAKSLVVLFPKDSAEAIAIVNLQPWQ